MVNDEFSDELQSVTQYLIKKLAPFLAVTDQMEDALRILAQDNGRFARNDQIIAAGDAYSHIYLVNGGWAVRYKLLESGDRQIVNFALPGDFLCFNAALFEESDYYLSAQTEMDVFVMQITPFSKMLAIQPELALALSWANAHEEALMAERIVSLGRRTAMERMAHLFCELWRRLELLNLTEGSKFPMPLTQEDLADTLGLSTVHVNRTLQKLRANQLVATTGDQIRILDMKGLERTAGFDDGYLHFTETSNCRFK
ncbi:MAG: Crp/Fnr family transcriptional regulator [Rhodospirillales bacterium]